MGERGRELCGLRRILDNSLMVVCGGEVVVAVACNAVVADDVVAADGVVVAVGATTVVFVWVQ